FRDTRIRSLERRSVCRLLCYRRPRSLAFPALRERLLIFGDIATRGLSSLGCKFYQSVWLARITPRSISVLSASLGNSSSRFGSTRDHLDFASSIDLVIRD